MGNRASKNPFRFVFILFLAFGLFICGFAVFLAVGEQAYMKTARTAVARIDDIVTTTDSDGSRRTVAYVIYTADGEEYRSSVAGFSTSMLSEDGTLTVYYQPDEPGVCRVPGTSGYTFLLIGGMICLFVTLAIPLIRRLRRRNLLQNGTPIDVEVSEIYLDTSVRVNGKNPYVLLCKPPRERGQEDAVYKSPHIWSRPDENVIGKKVTVFVDPQNPQKHYVDLDSLQVP